MAKKTISITLPEDMSAEIDNLMQEEGFDSRSEFIRAMYRQYRKSRIPTDTATEEEIVAIERSRGEFERGEYVNLDQLHSELGTIRWS